MLNLCDGCNRGCKKSCSCCKSYNIAVTILGAIMFFLLGAIFATFNTAVVTAFLPFLIVLFVAFVVIFIITMLARSCNGCNYDCSDD